MSEVRSTIQDFYGGDAPWSLRLLLDRYRDEVLREAAERQRALPLSGAEGGVRDALADLIDPDKEN